MSFETYSYGNCDADTLLIQMTDDHEMELMEKEISHIRKLSPGQDFYMKAVKVNSWNDDLSPWKAPAVLGNEEFGDGAKDTLDYLLHELLPSERAESRKRVFLGGYSLAGLFALWAGCRTDRFCGIAAASPSVWFPGFIDFLKKNPPAAKSVYLSLGDREEKTRNALMSQVGNAVRSAHDHLQAAGKDCILEWNPGNHFRDPDLRTARGFAWLMLRDGK